MKLRYLHSDIEFMVDCILAKIGIGIVLPVISSLFATNFPELLWTGFHLWHFDSLTEEFLDKISVMDRALHVDCQKRFPVSPTNSMCQNASFGRGSTQIKDFICEMSSCIVARLSLNFCREHSSTRTSWALFNSSISWIFRRQLPQNASSRSANFSCSRACPSGFFIPTICTIHF